MGDGSVSIGGLNNLQFVVLQHQPGPAAAELREAGIFQLISELVISTQVCVDFFRNGASRYSTTRRLHRVPVKCVIPDLGRIVEDCGLIFISCCF